VSSAPSGAVEPVPGGAPGRAQHPPAPTTPAPATPAPAPVAPAAGGPWPDPDTAFYTVGQVGELLGVPAATLRRFDAVGVLRPARSSGGQRRYSSRQVQHARRLLQLTEEGLTLSAARRVAELEDTVDDLRQQLHDARGAPDGPPGDEAPVSP